MIDKDELDDLRDEEMMTDAMDEKHERMMRTDDDYFLEQIVSDFQHCSNEIYKIKNMCIHYGYDNFHGVINILSDIGR
jgi:hypothetical protein